MKNSFVFVLFAIALMATSLPAAASIVQFQLEMPEDVFEDAKYFLSTEGISKAVSAVGILDVLYVDSNGRNHSSQCSASIIDAEHLLTTYFCLNFQNQEEVVRVAFIPNYYDESETKDIQEYPVQVQPVEFDEELNFLILEVADDPSSKCGTVRLSDASPELEQPLIIVGHPYSGSKKISRWNCRMSETRSTTNIMHSCSTAPGSGGSPILLDGDYDVIGMHLGKNHDLNEGFGITIKAIAEKSSIVRSLLESGH